MDLVSSVSDHVAGLSSRSVMPLHGRMEKEELKLRRRKWRRRCKEVIYIEEEEEEEVGEKKLKGGKEEKYRGVGDGGG